MPSKRSNESTLNISFSKALKISAIQMILFIFMCIVVLQMFRDTTFLIALLIMSAVMIPVFAIMFRFMLSSRVSDEGVSMSIGRLLKWEDIRRVKKNWFPPFYILKTSKFGSKFCIIPSQKLLQQGISLEEVLQKHAPKNHVILTDTMT